MLSQHEPYSSPQTDHKYETRQSVAAPSLVVNFDLLRDTDSSGLLDSSGETIPNRFTTTQEFEHNFYAALEALQYIYDPTRFREALEHPRMPASQKYLKEVRKYALILKTAYLIFHADGLAPKPLHTFTKKLGTLNDWLASDQKSISVEKHLPIEAIETFESTEFTWAPAPVEVFQRRVQAILDEITTALESETLSAERFHDLRKSLRTLMNILQVSSSEHLFGHEHKMFLILHLLSKELGKRHDEVVQQNLNSRAGYDAEIIELTPQQRDSIRYAIALLRNFGLGDGGANRIQ